MAALVLGIWPGVAVADEAAEAPGSAAAAVSRPVGPPSPPETRSETWVRRYYAPVLGISPDVLGGVEDPAKPEPGAAPEAR